MVIKDIALEHVSFNGFRSRDIDKMRHVKVLPYLSVVQAVEGHYDITLGNGAPHNTGNGGFFVAPAHVQQTIVHNVDPTSEHMTCRWIFLKVTVNGTYDWDDLFRFPTVLPPQVSHEMNAIFDTLFMTDDVTERYIAYYQILKLLLSVGEEKEGPSPTYVGRATAFIHRHAAEKLTVRDIAAHVNLSSSRLHAVFQDQMGISPIAYLNHFRLTKAADLLSETDKTVTEIAAEVGIPDAVYFNKMFKKNYQLSPTAYRKQYTP